MWTSFTAFPRMWLIIESTTTSRRETVTSTPSFCAIVANAALVTRLTVCFTPSDSRYAERTIFSSWLCVAQMARSNDGIPSSARKLSSVASPRHTEASGKRSAAAFASCSSESIITIFCEDFLDFSANIFIKELFLGSTILLATSVPILPAPIIAIFFKSCWREPHSSRTLLKSFLETRTPRLHPGSITVFPLGKVVFPSISTYATRRGTGQSVRISISL